MCVWVGGSLRVISPRQARYYYYSFAWESRCIGEKEKESPSHSLLVAHTFFWLFPRLHDLPAERDCAPRALGRTRGAGTRDAVQKRWENRNRTRGALATGGASFLFFV